MDLENWEEPCIKKGKLINSEGKEVQIEKYFSYPIVFQTNKEHYNREYVLSEIEEKLDYWQKQGNAFLAGHSRVINRMNYKFAYAIQIYRIKTD